MRLFLLIFFVTFLALILSACNKPNVSAPPQSNLTENNVETRASFAIFTDGTFRVFTASKYHNLSQDVYITAQNPNTVIVKKENITWADFFKTLPMELSSDCLTTGTGQRFCTNQTKTLKFYINGKKVENFLEQKIQNGDKALITFGSESEQQIQNQIRGIPDIK